jgi:thiazole synthase
LSAALYLAQIDPGRHITVLDREDPEAQRSKGTLAGSMAAAGMLAPQSERLPKGPLLDLCLASRLMYPEFVNSVESLARDYYVSEEGSDAGRGLGSSGDEDDAEPWSTGYMSSGGFMAPAFAGDSVATWAPPQEGGTATWLDSFQVREMEPHLHPDVVGGWWFPDDASVDSRRLTGSLRAACVSSGVQLLCGPEYEISSLDLSNGECRGLWLQKGRYVTANSVLVANGSWMRNLLPVPIEPHKGQSLSLRMPPDRPPLLRRVLFAQDTYIVPKADGRVVVGATVEAGSYDPSVTPAGLLHVLTHALQLVPALKDLPVEETWAGLRPTTPDKGPILGRTPWKNLYVAGGYWRNGVLLAPKTGQLVASLMAGIQLSREDQDLLDVFAWDRFTSSGKGIALAAQSRYAASIHPIHSRKTGTGVASSVGTELGVYSSARAAAEERSRDRSLLMPPSAGSDGSNVDPDEAFEHAASLGKLDSAAYTFGDKKIDSPSSTTTTSSEVENVETRPYEGSPDALTVGSASVESASDEVVMRPDHEPRAAPVATVSTNTIPRPESLEKAYADIRANKARQVVEMDDTTEEKRPDPGFRIFHLGDDGQAREVPPYTTPADFLASLRRDQAKTNEPDVATAPTDPACASPEHMESVEERAADPEPWSKSFPEGASSLSSSSPSAYNERTYDGYQDIQQANARATRQEELRAMREARRKNRQDPSTIDAKQIGATRA